MARKPFAGLRPLCAALMFVCAPAAHAQFYCPPMFIPDNQAPATLTGELRPPREIACYFFDAEAGQTARLRVTGGNVAIVMIGDEKPETDMTFRTIGQLSEPMALRSYVCFSQMRSRRFR